MKRVVLIGSGNVATSLAHGLCEVCELVQVYSRRIEHAQRLVEAVRGATAAGGSRVAMRGPVAICDWGEMVRDADAYVVAVSDDAIADVVAAVPDNGALWVHTSGSKPMEVFAGQRERYGVLYPMQSFSRELVTPLEEVHVFVEGNSAESLADIRELAELLSRHVSVADSEQRRRLHLAAVFACNFANHMWTLSAEVLAEHGLPQEAMLPLIRTTVDKLSHLTPAASQTGPAMRHDEQVIAAHLAMLDGDKREIYQLVTHSIEERNPINNEPKRKTEKG